MALVENPAPARHVEFCRRPAEPFTTVDSPQEMLVVGCHLANKRAQLKMRLCGGVGRHAQDTWEDLS